jgi:hypothetical protein
MEEDYLDPPASLAGHHFQRYLVDSAVECAESC